MERARAQVTLLAAHAAGPEKAARTIPPWALSALDDEVKSPIP